MKKLLHLDDATGEARLSLPRGIYSEQAVQIAAHVFDRSLEVYLGSERGGLAVTLKARGASGSARLERLAREFLNELLNQEYRFLVGRFNERISSRIVAQVLLSARGGENPAPPPQLGAEFEEEAGRLMAEAEEEMRRTMPKKIPSQGAPLPAWEGPEAGL